MESELYKTGIRRIIAAFIDYLILYIPVIILYWNFGEYTFVKHIIRWYSLIPITYSILGHYFYGQTIGKALTNVKVVDKSGSASLTFLQAVLRDGIWVMIIIVYIIFYLLYLGGIVSYYNTRLVSYILKNFHYIWMIIEIISMMTNQKRRAIHDFIAGTVVIRTK